LFFYDRSNLVVNLFGWSIEEGTLTSSNWKRRDCFAKSARSDRRMERRDCFVTPLRFVPRSDNKKRSLRGSETTEVISPLILFGWSFEEGIFTSSIGKDETASQRRLAVTDEWKGETATSLHFVSFRSVTTRNGHCEGVKRPKQSRS